MSGMTREEAIIILDGFKDNPLFNEQHKKALDMAISALAENKPEHEKLMNEIKGEIEQMPVVLLNGFDHIDRTDTLEIIDKHMEKEFESDNKSEWIPLSYRPMTEDELKDYEGRIDIDGEPMILNCHLPESGAEVLITANGYVGIDTFCNGDGECYFEDTDIDEVTAWMPLPEPYNPNKGDKE